MYLDSFSRLREFRGIGGRLEGETTVSRGRMGGEKAGDASAMKIRRVSADYTTRRASRVVLSRQLSETLPANSLVFGLSVFSQGLLVPDRRYLLTSEKYYSKYFRSSNSPLRVSFSNGEGRIRKKRNSLSIDITTLFSSLP